MTFQLIEWATPTLTEFAALAVATLASLDLKVPDILSLESILLVQCHYRLGVDHLNNQDKGKDLVVDLEDNLEEDLVDSIQEVDLEDNIQEDFLELEDNILVLEDNTQVDSTLELEDNILVELVDSTLVLEDNIQGVPQEDSTQVLVVNTLEVLLVDNILLLEELLEVDSLKSLSSLNPLHSLNNLSMYLHHQNLNPQLKM